ncbi:MAG: uroporphyrinogen decarboxylase family protein [Acidobacteriota bacterium]
MSKIERVKATLRGERVDRLPFTFWHHFGLQKEPGERHAEATLEFYRKFDVDILKVMSDFPYPLPEGIERIEDPADWTRLEPLKNPFPEQIKALKLIHREIKGQALFVETIFQSWTVAEKLSSKKTLQRLKDEDPQLLRRALRVISESQANHARLALEAGAAGVFLAVAASDAMVLDRAEYSKLVRESDLIVLDAAKEKGELNILHVHGNKPHFEELVRYPVHVINYSVHGTGMNMAATKMRFSGTLMGGLDETTLTDPNQEQLRQQIQSAVQAMHKRRLILAPGCSVPDDISDEALLRVRDILRES